MANRFREFIESIVFAGLKPRVPQPQKRFQWLGPLRKPLDRFLDVPPPSDPLYLSNRPLAKRVQFAALLVTPCVLLAVGLMMALSNRIPMPGAGRTPVPPAAEIARRTLPNLDKDVKVPENHDLEVIEIHIEHAAQPVIHCTVRNNTTRDIPHGEIVIDLTDSNGSQVGGVKLPVNVQSHRTGKFQVPIKQTNEIGRAHV